MEVQEGVACVEHFDHFVAPCFEHFLHPCCLDLEHLDQVVAQFRVQVVVQVVQL